MPPPADTDGRTVAADGRANRGSVYPALPRRSLQRPVPRPHAAGPHTPANREQCREQGGQAVRGWRCRGSPCVLTADIAFAGARRGSIRCGGTGTTCCACCSSATCAPTPSSLCCLSRSPTGWSRRVQPRAAGGCGCLTRRARQVLVTTIVITMFGEIIPQSICGRNPVSAERAACLHAAHAGGAAVDGSRHHRHPMVVCSAALSTGAAACCAAPLRPPPTLRAGLAVEQGAQRSHRRRGWRLLPPRRAARADQADAGARGARQRRASGGAAAFSLAVPALPPDSAALCRLEALCPSRRPSWRR